MANAFYDTVSRHTLGRNLYWTQLKPLLNVIVMLQKLLDHCGVHGGLHIDQGPAQQVEQKFQIWFICWHHAAGKNDVFTLPGVVRANHWGVALSYHLHCCSSLRGLLSFRQQCFPYLSHSTHTPERKRFGPLAPRPRTNRSRHKLGALLLRRHWSQS